MGQLVFVMCRWAECGSTGVCDMQVGAVWVNCWLVFVMCRWAQCGSTGVCDVQVGTVWVNCWLVRDLNLPFGGSKESGIGREGGLDSMDFFRQEKTVCVHI